MTDRMEDKDRDVEALEHDDVVSQEESARVDSESVSALEAFTKDDEVGQRSKISLKEILGGDILTAEGLRRQMGLLLLCFFFIIVYISNRYSSEQEMIEIEKLKEELMEVKNRALTRSGELTVKSRQSQIEKSLSQSADSLLHVSNEPPFGIYLEEGE